MRLTNGKMLHYSLSFLEASNGLPTTSRVLDSLENSLIVFVSVTVRLGILMPRSNVAVPGLALKKRTFRKPLGFVVFATVLFVAAAQDGMLISKTGKHSSVAEGFCLSAPDEDKIVPLDRELTFLEISAMRNSFQHWRMLHSVVVKSLTGQMWLSNISYYHIFRMPATLLIWQDI